MLWRVIEDEVVPTSKELGVSQIVWSPIAQGVLTGKYKPGQAPPEGSRAADEKGGADMIKRFMNDEVLTAVQGLEPVAEDCGLTMAQLAVAWVLQNDNVAAALVGASRPEQVAENVKAAGVKLDADVMSRIDDVLGDIVVRDPAKTAEGDAEDPRRLRHRRPLSRRSDPARAAGQSCAARPGGASLARSSTSPRSRRTSSRCAVRHRRDLAQPTVDVDVRLR